MAMKTVCAALALVAALSVSAALSAPLTAQENREGVGQGLADRMHDLNLTEEQEAKIAEIRKEARPKVEEAAKECAGLGKEEMDKIRQVLNPNQTQKLAALREERKEHRIGGLAARIAHLADLDLTDAELAQIQDIHNQYRPKIEQAMEGFRGILTDEQRKVREEGVKAGKKHSEIVASLNLTGEQKEKMATVRKEVGTLVREELEKMRDVLSAEQQEKLAELKDERRDRARDRVACAIANATDLGLTDQQKSQIAAIRMECRPKIHEAGNKLRAAVRDEVGAIVAVIKG